MCYCHRRMPSVAGLVKSGSLSLQNHKFGNPVSWDQEASAFRVFLTMFSDSLSLDGDDQDFLAPTDGGSRLASLFGGGGKNDVTESLRYKPAKTPRSSLVPDAAGKSVEGETGESGGALMAACAVHCFKYEGSGYAAQGKVMCALLANPSQNEYKLLLYYTKNKPVMQTFITSGFTFTVQAERYVTLYDQERRGWSLMFASDQDLATFTRQVCVARFVAGGGQEAVQQDALLGDSFTTQVDDNVEIRYDTLALSNIKTTPLSREAGGQLKRFKLGRGKFSSVLESCLVGAGRGGRRYVLAPPTQVPDADRADSAQPGVTGLLYDITIVRLKSKDQSSRGQSMTPVPERTDSPGLPGGPGLPGAGDQEGERGRAASAASEGDMRGRTRSIEEQLQHQKPERPDKANLLSRMARMGQAILPASRQDADDSPHTPDTDSAPATPQPQVMEPAVGVAHPQTTPQLPHQTVLTATPTVIGQPMTQMGQPMTQMGQPMTQMGQPMTQMGQPIMQPMGQMGQPIQQPIQQGHRGSLQGQQLALYQPLHNAYPQPVYQPVTEPPAYPGQTQTVRSGERSEDLSGYVGESRQLHSELRVSISRINDKLDKINDKVDKVGVAPVAGVIPTLESTTLLHNLQRIIEENQTLKQDVLERGEKIHEQSEKIRQLLTKTQSVMEQSNSVIEQRCASYEQAVQQCQDKIVKLEREKVSLSDELSSVRAELSGVGVELREARQHSHALSASLDQRLQTNHAHTTELESLKAARTESEYSLTSVQSSLEAEVRLRRGVEEELARTRQLLSDARQGQDAARTESELMRAELREMQADYEHRLSHNVTKSVQLTAETQDLRLEYDNQLSDLRNQLRDANAKNSRLEEESGRLKAENEATINQLERKLGEYSSKNASLEEETSRTRSEYEGRVEALEKRIKDNLEKAKEMKSRFESRIDELESSESELREELQQVKQERDRQQAQLQQQLEQKSTSGGQDLGNEIKSIMSKVYHELRAKLEPEQQYSGQYLQQLILVTIKETTLKLMQPSKEEAPSSEESDDDEEEEGDEEDEEYEEEEQEEKEEKVDEKQNEDDDEDDGEAEKEKEDFSSEVAESSSSVDTVLKMTTPVAEEIAESGSNAEHVEVNDEKPQEKVETDESGVDDEIVKGTEPALDSGPQIRMVSETVAETINEERREQSGQKTDTHHEESDSNQVVDNDEVCAEEEVREEAADPSETVAADEMHLVNQPDNQNEDSSAAETPGVPSESEEAMPVGDQSSVDSSLPTTDPDSATDPIVDSVMSTAATGPVTNVATEDATDHAGDTTDAATNALPVSATEQSSSPEVTENTNVAEEEKTLPTTEEKEKEEGRTNEKEEKKEKEFRYDPLSGRRTPPEDDMRDVFGELDSDSDTPFRALPSTKPRSASQTGQTGHSGPAPDARKPQHTEESFDDDGKPQPPPPPLFPDSDDDSDFEWLK